MLQVGSGAGGRSAASGTICRSFMAPLAFQPLQKGPDLIQRAPLCPGALPASPAQQAAWHWLRCLPILVG